MATAILVVEDDADINNLLCTILKKQDYEVTAAYSGTEALMRLDAGGYDMLILDLNLPGLSGEEVVKHVRTSNTLPILIISARTALEDRVALLKLGADDYIQKPFERAEVIARVEAHLRRATKFSTNVDTLKFKNITLYKDSREVRVNDEIVALTAHEFDILMLLMERPDRVFSRQNIYSSVWNGDYYGEDNTVNVHVSNIRAKLAKVDKNEYIKTVWGIGFKMAEQK